MAVSLKLNFYYFLGFESLTKEVVVKNNTLTPVTFNLHPEITSLAYNSYKSLLQTLANITYTCPSIAKLQV